MTGRVHNFCAGPCTLPLEVLEEASRELVDYQGAGMSLIEMSHRAKEYDAVHKEAMALALEVFGVPDDFHVLFIQGGATLQFSMIPMNLLGRGERAGYVNSGSWGKAAIRDAAPHGDIYTAWDGAEHEYRRMPDDGELDIREHTRYLHITSNETIGGIRFASWPEVGVPLVADMSSELMSRPIPWRRFDLVYGGVQKNLGPAGLAVVLVRKSVVEAAKPEVGSYLRYDVHAKSDSLFNTPPMFPIYVMGKVLRWMKDKGGLEAMEREAAHKSGILYELIDRSGGYYRCPVEPRDRSHMNVVFRLPDEDLEKKFLAEAEQADLVNLKGHRSVGGCRASVYNAMPVAGVEALASFMREFQSRNG